ncbi:phosphoribulokinase/uridine kinase family protein [Porphyromonas gingivalis F0185]|uniref:nucleoside kinase n=1 Tax=Porphyromonas gingivalis TaxID=837 RepID=UPI0003AD3D79|nr:nucleoside kinase [Porphyromonas gingivalis]ERJ81556.1 phosphoribulokinase/uridine kinase family protein [Porphyromonas gingivalis F0185]PDP65062.1 nucleoside kinase [Porphyromonas gingivalis]
MDKICIYCDNLDRYEEFPHGISLERVAEYFQDDLGFRPFNAQVNHCTRDLGFRLYEPSDVLFASFSDESGMRTYVRTLSFILSKAVADILPGSKLFIEHSLSNGYYCQIKNAHMITPGEIVRIKERMESLIVADIPFRAHCERTEEVAAMFRSMGYEDKADLLETRGMPYSRYYDLDGYPDYYYGSLAPSTGYIGLFGLEPYLDGVLLRIPRRDKPEELAPFVPQPMMRQVFADHDRLLDILQVTHVGSLNKAVDRNNISTMVQVSEAMQEKQIAAIADDIAHKYKEGVRVVLISGPSSSGKTTFCKRLQTQLLTNYIRPYGLSLDDYFINREDSPRDESGDYDFESLYALDLPLFNKDLKQMIAGEEVSLPTYDFATGMRVYKGNTIQLKDGDILILEGIHALNPELIPGVPESSTYKIYVSALTAIGLDAHNRIPSTDNRLIRRLVRDYRYRNYSGLGTLRRWQSVRRGEEKWVFPFQENAHVMFNSAMLYELAVLRAYAEPILQAIPRNEPEYAEARRLLRFLSSFRMIPARLLPNNSLMREFLGGSTFHY